MAKNEFLPFGIADGANVLTNDEYGKLTARTNGFSSGVAKSQELNKVWRQASVIATVVAQFIAETNNQDVLDDGNLATLQKGLLSALKATVSSNVPNASLTTAGITKLSNATDSNAENIAATSKAVRQVADALNTKQDKGDYATNSALNEVRVLANTANQNAANANNNANSRLAKAQNGADILDKAEFVNNIGLTKTMDLAREALPKNSTERFTSGPHTIQSITDDYVTLRLKKPDGRYTFFESTPHDSKAICAIGYREPDQTNINVVYLPKKSGMVAMADEVYSKSAVYTKDEVYSKSESDARFSRQKNVGLLEPVGWWRDSDTGYTRQWGYLGREEGSVGTTVVTFPTQFFRECTSVTVAHIRVSGQVMLSVGGVTKSGFTVIPSEKCNGVFWSAEGY